ncbi:hypothetical protein JCM11641_002688 [Rhodosporidiobolus odoratus]
MDLTTAYTSLLISLPHPFPRTLSLSLPSATPLSSLPCHLPLPVSYLQYSTGLSLPRSSSAPLSTLRGASPNEGGFVALRVGQRTKGGKGGFASQLRAQGGRMSSNKAQNTDSCRGLDGRRLSTMKEAQKLASLLASEPDRLAAAALAKQQKLDELTAEIARLERQAGVEATPAASTSSSFSSAATAAGPSGEGKAAAGGSGQGNGVKRRLDDQKYVEESREIIGGVKDAVRAAMLKKRKKNKSTASTLTSSTPSDAAPGKENAVPEIIESAQDVKGKGKAKAVEPEEEVEGEGEKEGEAAETA